MWYHDSHKLEIQKVINIIGLLLFILVTLFAGAVLVDIPVIPDYLALHTFLETITVVIASLIFSVGWNAYRRGLPGNLLVIACAFLGVATLDFSHMLSYSGMPDFFTPSGPQKATNFWLFARFLAAITLLWVAVSTWRPANSIRFRYTTLGLVFFFVVIVHWLVLFHENWLPIAYKPGKGLTASKIYSEYFIIFLNLIAAGFLCKRLGQQLNFNAAGLIGVVSSMAMSELFFTRYQDLTDLFNLMGHLYKVVSYIFLYYAVFVETIEYPYNQLRDSQNQLQATLDVLPDMLLEVSRNGQIGFYRTTNNHLLTAIVKHNLSKSVGEFLSRSAEEVFIAALLEAEKKGLSQGKQIEIETAEGNRWFELSVSRKPVKPGVELRFIVLLHDITQRKQVEAELRIAATAFESQEGIIITDAHNVILRVNKSFTQITGYTAKDVIGHKPSLLASGRHDDKFFAAMWTQLNTNGTWEGEIWNRRKNGTIFIELLTITAVTDHKNKVSNYVASFSDITQRKKAEDEIQNLAFFDPLTQLPNRRMLLNRLQHTMVTSKRSGKTSALLFIDLDNFKTLNDTLGHGVGDLLLQLVAQRLLSTVREVDTVARLGGDEFLVILGELSRLHVDAVNYAGGVGDKILQVLNQSFQLGPYEYHITPSIGITLFNDQHPTDELLKQADIAMYQAKKSGRNTMRFFDPQMQDAINNRAALENQIRQAVELRQFQLFYQIQVDLYKRPIGAEALIRWIHPERGFVSPADFIPLAEETGLILSVGHWVLDSACSQLKSWQHNDFSRELVLSINVSAQQFREGDFVAQVESAVKRYSVNPRLLKLELTESLLLDNIDDTINIMNSLKQLGVQFSLDDFGTGYSSLQYLKLLPLNQLKIDQSFVRDISIDSNDEAIVSTIIVMAHSLNLDVIAEGVETEFQRKLLENMGCKQYQGYFFGKPMAIEQFQIELQKMTINTPKKTSPHLQENHTGFI
ncbi:EAL domain-containing protein [Methylomonas sp. AM2-LC]|uniref:bifunctional diguanylate cyclase/phosphodiesterase n=1 Tax=Methylomonas sp. AM2-LC TaxID=3153301 RepID=UPI003263CF4A